MTLFKFSKILQKVDIPVGHYATQQEETPYIIYQELATKQMYVSGEAVQEDISIEVVHFTKEEFDPTLERLKQVLRKHKIGFDIVHGYDPEAKNTVNQFTLTISNDLEADHE